MVTACARVLTTDGYEKASVNRIAELAGVSIGSLYQYFPTKEALVAAVIKRHSEAMISRFERDLGDVAFLPMRDAAREVIARALAAMAVEPELHRVIMEQVPRVGELIRPREFEERVAFLLRAYLEFHRHEIRPMNLDVAVEVLVTCVEAVANAMVLRDKREAVRDEVIDELAILVLRYVERPERA